MRKAMVLCLLFCVIYLLVACADNNKINATTNPTSTPANMPLPVVEATLGPLPQNCPDLPTPKTLSANFAPGVGSSPMYVVGAPIIGLSPGNPTKYGYLQKVLWVMEPSFAGKVTVQGANLADNTPLWFQVGGRNIVSTFVFESNSPGTLIQPGEWGNGLPF